jgi:hypothetical protein
MSYYITWSSFLTCKSCHCWGLGLTFSDPIHKKSAGNLNLYDFCHLPKKLAAVSPFSCQLFFINRPLVWSIPILRKSGKKFKYKNCGNLGKKSISKVRKYGNLRLFICRTLATYRFFSICGNMGKCCGIVVFSLLNNVWPATRRWERTANRGLQIGGLWLR